MTMTFSLQSSIKSTMSEASPPLPVHLHGLVFKHRTTTTLYLKTWTNLKLCGTKV